MKKYVALVIILWGLVPLSITWGQDVRVEASISHQTAGVGEPIQVTISVTGARNAQIPGNFAVPGLPIVGRSQSTQINIVNFQMLTTVNYTFTMIPQQEGTFTIPSLAIEAGGQVVQTSPLTLEVQGVAQQLPPSVGSGQVFRPQQPPSTGGNRPVQAPQPNAGVPIDQIARLELIVPQTEVYVGQVVPVEMRLYFDQRFQFELGQFPEFSGEGIVTQKLSEPIQRTQNIGGVTYEVIIFHTSITPVKMGPLQIEPARMSCQVIVPGGRSQSMGSIFDDFFGGDPFSGMFGERRQIELASDPVQLQALALPKDHRPADFSGAIGQFSLTQRISSGTAQVGEPMTLSVDITGQGNFPSITAPGLTDTEGWRTYTGSDQFRPSDSVGFGGTKQFDITVMPLQETDRTPVAQFSYFDPVEKRYITLRGESQPVLVRGGSAPAAPTAQATPAPSLVAPPPPAIVADAASSAEPPAVAIEPLRSSYPGSFVALPLRPEFLVANGAALVALLALSGVVLLRRRAAAVPARVQRLRKEQSQLLEKLENPALEALAFYEGATEFIQKQARIHAQDPDTPVAERSLVENPLLTPEVRAELRRILDCHDELRFSSRPQSPSKLHRESAISALQALRRQLS